MTHPKFFLSLLVIFLVAACAPRTSDPAEFISLNKQHELMLLGSWKLTKLRDGTLPQPNQTRTLIFQSDGTMKMDLWEHELTYQYQAMPDPDHLRLTLTASTNPNDKPGAVYVQAMVIQSDTLVLDGDQFTRTANASGTLTPSVQTPATTPSSSTGAPSTVAAHLDQDFDLRIGQTALLVDSSDQFGIMFFDVKDDSRCPQGMSCVWSGEVRARIMFQENGILHPPILELTTLPNDPRHTISVQDYQVALVQVKPPKLVNVEIKPGDYIGTFHITRPNVTPTPVSNTTTGALDQPITVKMFQVVEFPQAQLKVTLNGVLEESRCPKQVDCVQAGRALVSFLLEHNQRLGYFALSTSPPDGRTHAYFQGYDVELLDVAPYPDTLDQKIPTTAYLATIVVHTYLPTLAVRKNEGFAVKVGQSATLVDENVQVSFERVVSDTRCAYGVMCAIQGNAQLQATLTQADGTKQTFVLNTDDIKNNQRIPDTGAFGIELITLTPYPRADLGSPGIPPDEYEATFVVRKFASPGPIPTQPPATPAPPTACLGLTPKDVQDILGQDVNAAPAPNVLIQLAKDPDSFYKGTGLCGYPTVAKNLTDSIEPNSPYVFSPYRAAEALTAARLSGVALLELVRVAGIVRAANPQGDETPYLIFKTRVTAGALDGALDTLQTLPDGSPDVHFEKVAGLGDEGVWIWRVTPVAHYAVLLVREKDSFLIIEALLSNTMSESAAKEAIHADMEKIMH